VWVTRTGLASAELAASGASPHPVSVRTGVGLDEPDGTGEHNL